MKIKKLISFFLILILSIQVLPLQQIAAWLSSGQVTEEIAHSLDPAKARSPLLEKDPALPVQSLNTGSQVLLALTLKKYHRDEVLIIRASDEILSPPPND